jgi:hypothetical protein
MKSIIGRLALFVTEIMFAMYGVGQMRHGVFVYQNWYRADIYSPGIVATGISVSLLSILLPPAWVVERIAKLFEKKKVATYRPHRRHHSK